MSNRPWKRDWEMSRTQFEKLENPRQNRYMLAIVVLLFILGAGSGAVAQMSREGAWTQVLVNAGHPLAQDYVLTLREVDGGPHQMDERVADRAQRLLDAARKEGFRLQIADAYLSVGEIRARQEGGGFSPDAEWALPRGCSEHHTGLAVDFSAPGEAASVEFGESLAGRWLLQHAADYGFIQRYPPDKTENTGVAYSPWHYRYVGKKTAAEMKKAGLCLEEYLAAGGEEEKANGT